MNGRYEVQASVPEIKVQKHQCSSFIAKAQANRMQAKKGGLFPLGLHDTQASWKLLNRMSDMLY